MFDRLIGAIESEVVKKIYRLNPVAAPTTTIPQEQMVMEKKDIFGDKQQTPQEASGEPADLPAQVGQIKPVAAATKKIGRNDPCWCGSGKKWKKCHYPELG